MADLNTVALTGNLTRDAELRGENQNVLAVRLAVSGRRKVGETWEDVGHFFDVTVFGNRAAGLAPHMTKGRRIAVQGRLESREFTVDDQKRYGVQVIAEDVVLLGGPRDEAAAPEAAQATA
jgi:single-strand DNA-binding protein